MADSIKLSIVTIVKNDDAGLNSTIESIINSKIPCEHIIVDGSDLKLSPATLSKNTKHFWGPDQGISDAFNRGIILASADYILFLNAGDELLPVAAPLIIDTLGDDRLDCIWFSVLRILEGGKKTIFIPRLKYLKYAMSAPHQGLIVRKSIFLEIGNFPMQKYSMDHHFALRIISRNPKYKIVSFDLPIATYPSGGHSSKGGSLPFFFNILNTLKIQPIYLPISIMVNLGLIIKHSYIKIRNNV